MYNKAFIITFNKGGITDTFNYNKFHDSLVSTKGIISWWHYLESSYIVIVDWNISATNISNVVRDLMPNKLFIVIELNLENHNGWLPKEAWDWINKFIK